MIRPQLRPLFAQWGIIQAPRPRTVSARSVGWIWKKRSKGCGRGFSAFALSQPFADSATNRLNPESSLRGIWFWGFRLGIFFKSKSDIGGKFRIWGKICALDNSIVAN